MKNNFLLYLIFLIAANANGQCHSVFRDMKVQPPQIPAGYQAVKNECPFDFYYVTHVQSTSATSNALYHLWNGKSWTTLNETVFSGGVMQLIKWNDRLIGFGRVKGIDGIMAPKGRYIRFAEYKNGQWDTLQGGTFDSTDYIQYEVAGTRSGLYFSYVYNQLDSQGNRWNHRSVSCYDTVSRQFEKIIDSKGIWNYPIFMGGDSRLLLGGVYQVNGKNVNGFCYLLGDSIIFNNSKKVSFGYDYSYGIDGSDDHIYAVGVGLGMIYPPVLEYGDSFIQERMTPDFIGGGKIWALKGMLVFQYAMHNSSSANFSMLCKGEKKWRTMSLSGTFKDYDDMFVSKDGYYMQDVKTGKVLELVPGSGVEGRAFVDIDANCLYDEGKDSLLRFFRIELKSDHFQAMTYTDDSGRYRQIVPLDTISVSGGNAEVTCMGVKSVTTYESDRIYTLDLPMKKPAGFDLDVLTNNAKTIRWNSGASYMVTIENKGMPCDSAWFEFRLDPKLKLLPQSDPAITSINGNIVKGRLKNLGYYDRRRIGINFWVDTATNKVDSLLCNAFSAYSYNNELDSLNNKTGFCQTVVYSLDPNHKQCVQDSIPPDKSAVLEYRIDFQNEGKADAVDVAITDMLSWLLSPETVHVVTASHPYSMTLDGSVLYVDFRNINLRPKDSSEALSKGYIIFSITTKAGLKQGDSILNSAAIYFDLNKALNTNTAKVFISSLKDPVNVVASITLPASLIISPNPASTVIHITVAQMEDLYVYNSAGKLLYTEKAGVLPVSLDISAWPAGFYVVRCGNQSGKFIKVGD